LALEDRGAQRDWRRMLTFLFAKSIEGSGGIDRPLEALHRLEPCLGEQGLADNPVQALVLSDCLEIAAGKAGGQGLGEWEDRYRRGCEVGLEAVNDAKDRNALLLALGRLGWDRRPGVGVDARGTPDIIWLPVPDTDTPAFYIARYLVTQAQFQAFVETPDGYADARHWRGFESSRSEPANPSWPEPNGPRTDVDWFEALAFCRWLTARSAVAKPDWWVGLPTDGEWVQAYVGAIDRDFPWNGPSDPNRCANFRGSGLERTSAVGIFPAGRANSGALDMAGNVWEWVLDKYDLESDTLGGSEVDDSNDRRVLRGGSWGGNPDSLRSSNRFRFDPDFRVDFIGFRVVCRPPSSSVDH